MRVGDCGHGVNLEVLVRADGRDEFDGSPVGERGFRIVEPVVGQMAHVSAVHMRYALCNFTTGYATVQIAELLTDLVNKLLGTLFVHQRVVQVVPASEDLDISHVVSVDSRSVHSAVVHLARKDLISEEIVSKKTGVRVGHIVAVLDRHIRQVSQKSMHGVVLLLNVIQMAGILVDTVRAEDVLE